MHGRAYLRPNADLPADSDLCGHDDLPAVHYVRRSRQPDVRRHPDLYVWEHLSRDADLRRYGDMPRHDLPRIPDLPDIHHLCGVHHLRRWSHLPLHGDMRGVLHLPWHTDMSRHPDLPG